MEEVEHPHEHTTHALRDVIEALPRYIPCGEDHMEPDTNGAGEWLKLSDVRAVVHKAATLGAPVAHPAPLDREAIARSLKARYNLRQSIPELMMGLDVALDQSGGTEPAPEEQTTIAENLERMLDDQTGGVG